MGERAGERGGGAAGSERRVGGPDWWHYLCRGGVGRLRLRGGLGRGAGDLAPDAPAAGVSTARAQRFLSLARDRGLWPRSLAPKQDVPQPLAPAVPRFGGAGEAQVAGRRVSSQEQGVKSNDAKR